MRETSVRSSILTLVLLWAAALSFAQTASDSAFLSHPSGRYRGESLPPVSAQSISFSGNYSYSFGGGVAVLKADNVMNSNATATGPLRFSLWLTSSPFPSSGYNTASYPITSSLAAGASIAPVNGSGTSVPFTLPPTGCYWVTLVLEEQVSSTWTTRDYGGFSKSIDVGGGCIPAFSASPASISPGGSSTLSWTTIGTVSGVTIDNGVGSQPANGSKSVTPPSTTVYTLVASGTANGNTVSKQATVTVSASALHVTASGSPTAGTVPFSTSFSAFASGGVPPYSFKWSTGETGSTMTHQWTSNGTAGVNVVVTDSTSATATSNTVIVTANNPVATGPCADPNYVCLSGSRFAIKIDWKTTDGKSSGTATPIKYTPDSGLFWFFGPDNIEVLLKVLNACGLNGKYWIFSAATTDVEYTITVLDTTNSNKKTYFHAGGTPAPAITDTDGLPCSGGLTSTEPEGIIGATSTLAIVDAPALPNATNLCADPSRVCLSSSRFAIKIDWKTTDGKSSGTATPIKYTPDSGLFWFFGPDNIEVLLKVLNGCALNNKYWVFAAATTDVEYTITVTDTANGQTKTYFHAGGTPAPAITDTDAMQCSQ